MKIRNSLSRFGLKPWLLVVALTMSGCASGPPFQKIADIPTGKGLIYIYRPSVMHGVALVPYIVINDLNAIPLKVGGYYPYFSSPGEVTISITHTGKRSITINVKAGETYYVKAGTIFMALGIPYIESVPAEVGLSGVSECKRLPDVPGV
jgi:hypothetical protein